jgi:23S rRNA pseudouridine1911/1915/1917 synthase
MRIEDSDYNPAGRATVQIAVPPECAGLRLDQALARLLPRYSRSCLAQWIRAGRVALNGRIERPRHVVARGDLIVVEPAPEPDRLAYRPEALPLDIVYEDVHLLVVNKPPGLVVHPGAGNWQGTLLNALLARSPALAALPRAGIVHRLDKDTSGLLVVAKTLEAQADLVRQLQARSLMREYLALVHGRVARAGKVDAPIGRHPRARTRMAVTSRGRPAVTHYEVAERYARATLLRIRLETGRTHQIRVHLSALGHPVVGDPVYGKRAAGPSFHRQALHAARLALVHPATGNAMSWQADPPEDMRELIATLRRGEAAMGKEAHAACQGPQRR